MPKVFRSKELEFVERQASVPEFRWNTTPKLANLVNSKYLQFDVRSLGPKKFSFPYHFHRASEELFMIISGEATLRTREGFQKVLAGDIIFFEEGPTSAHQLYNHSDALCVYLDLRTNIGIDVTEYPDSGKVNILPFGEVFDYNSKVDYFKGEENVADHWPEELL